MAVRVISCGKQAYLNSQMSGALLVYGQKVETLHVKQILISQHPRGNSFHARAQKMSKDFQVFPPQDDHQNWSSHNTRPVDT